METIFSDFNIILFATTALHKLIRWKQHLTATQEYLPPSFKRFRTVFSMMSIISELAIIITTLISGVWWSSSITILILVFYSSGIFLKDRELNGQNVIQTSCACGGLAGDFILGKSLLVRNALFMAPSIILLTLINGESFIVLLKDQTLFVNVSAAVISITLLVLINGIFSAFEILNLTYEHAVKHVLSAYKVRRAS